MTSTLVEKARSARSSVWSTWVDLHAYGEDELVAGLLFDDRMTSTPVEKTETCRALSLATRMISSFLLLSRTGIPRFMRHVKLEILVA